MQHMRILVKLAVFGLQNNGIVVVVSLMRFRCYSRVVDVSSRVVAVRRAPVARSHM